MLSSVKKNPAIAVALTVTDQETLQQIKKVIVGARFSRPVAKGGVTPPLLLEIRIDRFRRLDEEYVLQKIRSFRKTGLSLIATIRSRREGGGTSLSDAERIGLFKKVLPFVKIIDLELGSTQLRKVVIPLAIRKRKRVILSYHNFKSTPSDRALNSLLRKSIRAGADWTKIAVTPKTREDVARLLLFTQHNRDKNLISIAMGRLGQTTRILAPLFGSRLTYGFVGRAQAPGQLSAHTLLNELKLWDKI